MLNSQIQSIIKSRYNQSQASQLRQQKFQYNMQSITKCIINLYWLTKFWQEIIKYQNWTPIKQISLYNCSIEDSKVFILTSFQWPQLKILDLRGNKLTDKGIKQLLEKDWLKLSNLYLNHNTIGNAGISLLIKKQLPLQRLSVYKTNISAQGLRGMPDCNLSQIIQLSLSQNNIGSTGIKILTKVYLPLIQILWLNECKIGNGGSKHLGKGKWPNLRSLQISNNKIEIEGVLALTNSQWRSLNKVYVKGTPFISINQLFAANWMAQYDLKISKQNEELFLMFQKIIESRLKHRK